jgi:hypothetical protein
VVKPAARGDETAGRDHLEKAAVARTPWRLWAPLMAKKRPVASREKLKAKWLETPMQDIFIDKGIPPWSWKSATAV